MNVPFNTVQDRIKYALRDFTSVGKGQSPFSFLTDEQVYQIHPERYAFYLQMLDALQDPSSGLLDRVLSIENKSRYARDKLQNNTRDIAKALRYLTLNLNKQSGGGSKSKQIASLILSIKTNRNRVSLIDENHYKNLVKELIKIDDDVWKDPILNENKPEYNTGCDWILAVYKILYSNTTLLKDSQNFFFDLCIRDYLIFETLKNEETSLSVFKKGIFEAVTSESLNQLQDAITGFDNSSRGICGNSAFAKLLKEQIKGFEINKEEISKHAKHTKANAERLKAEAAQLIVESKKNEDEAEGKKTSTVEYTEALAQASKKANQAKAKAEEAISARTEAVTAITDVKNAATALAKTDIENEAQELLNELEESSFTGLLEQATDIVKSVEAKQVVQAAHVATTKADDLKKEAEGLIAEAKDQQDLTQALEKANEASKKATAANVARTTAVSKIDDAKRKASGNVDIDKEADALFAKIPNETYKDLEKQATDIVKSLEAKQVVQAAQVATTRAEGLKKEAEDLTTEAESLNTESEKKKGDSAAYTTAMTLALNKADEAKTKAQEAISARTEAVAAIEDAKRKAPGNVGIDKEADVLLAKIPKDTFIKLITDATAIIDRLVAKNDAHAAQVAQEATTKAEGLKTEAEGLIANASTLAVAAETEKADYAKYINALRQVLNEANAAKTKAEDAFSARTEAVAAVEEARTKVTATALPGIEELLKRIPEHTFRKLVTDAKNIIEQVSSRIPINGDSSSTTKKSFETFVNNILKDIKKVYGIELNFHSNFKEQYFKDAPTTTNDLFKKKFDNIDAKDICEILSSIFRDEFYQNYKAQLPNFYDVIYYHYALDKIFLAYQDLLRVSTTTAPAQLQENEFLDIPFYKQIHKLVYGNDCKNWLHIKDVKEFVEVFFNDVQQKVHDKYKVYFDKSTPKKIIPDTENLLKWSDINQYVKQQKMPLMQPVLDIPKLLKTYQEKLPSPTDKDRITGDDVQNISSLMMIAVYNILEDSKYKDFLKKMSKNVKVATKDTKIQVRNQENFIKLIETVSKQVKDRYGDILSSTSITDLIKDIKKLEFTDEDIKFNIKDYDLYTKKDLQAFNKVIKDLAPTQLINDPSSNQRTLLYDILYYYYALDYIFDTKYPTDLTTPIFDKLRYKYVHKKTYEGKVWEFLGETNPDDFVTNFGTSAPSHSLYVDISTPKTFTFDASKLQEYINNENIDLKDAKLVSNLLQACQTKLDANDVNNPEYAMPCILLLILTNPDKKKLMSSLSSAPAVASAATTASSASAFVAPTSAAVTVPLMPFTPGSAYASVSLTTMPTVAPAPAAVAAPAAAAAPAAPPAAAAATAPSAPAKNKDKPQEQKSEAKLELDPPTAKVLNVLNTMLDSSSAPVKFRLKGGSYYTDLLDKVEKIQKDDKEASNGVDTEKELAKISEEVDTHPIFNPENEKVSMTDRVIFIAVTFMIRGLALFLIDWGINSQLITTFNRAFLYYTLIYFTLFMVWALLVNAGSDSENIPLKMAFYYVNWGANGIGRILAHLAVQTFLIPIPFIVREPMQGAPDLATFEKRRAVYRVLSNFTFFVWVMTSIIALRF